MNHDCPRCGGLCSCDDAGYDCDHDCDAWWSYADECYYYEDLD